MVSPGEARRVYRYGSKLKAITMPLPCNFEITCSFHDNALLSKWFDPAAITSSPKKRVLRAFYLVKLRY
jgi:hypothetical protein